MFNSKFGVGVLKHPGYNVGGGIGEAALLGAAFGGAKSLATGEDLLEGALLGGLTGGAMSGITGAIMPGADKLATTGATSTEEAVKQATDLAAQQTANASLNVADTYNAALSSAPASAKTLADMEAAKAAVAASNNVAPSALTATDTGGISDILNRPGLDLRQYTTPDTMMGKGLDWWEKQGLGGRAMYSGIGGAAYGMLNPEPVEMPQIQEQKSKLAGYNREGFTPYIAEQPNPYYSAQYRDYRTYAEGGIAALAGGGMGDNPNFPQGRLDTTQYATPTQLPASAAIVNSDYDTPTDTYTGEPLKMAEGGVTRYAVGGSGYSGIGPMGQFNSTFEPAPAPAPTTLSPGVSLDYKYQTVTPTVYHPTTPSASTVGATPSTAYSLADAMGLLQATNPNLAALYSGTPTATSSPVMSPAQLAAYQQQTASQQVPTNTIANLINPNPQGIAGMQVSPYVTPVASTPYPGHAAGTTDAERAAWNAVNAPGTVPGSAEWSKVTGIPEYAHGGIAGYNLGGYASGGNPRLLKGPGDGMSDNIPATIGGRQPARLADGEFVVPADVVSHLGNGSTDAGAKHLYSMMDKVRKARTGTKKQGKQIKADKFLPA